MKDQMVDSRMTRVEFDDLWRRCTTWAQWGSADELGTLNYIDGAVVVAAARLVRTGRTVSCSRDLDAEPAPDNPAPSEHRMTRLPTGSSGVDFVADYIGLQPHGHAHSHLDALGHVIFDGHVYGGLAVPDVLGADGLRRLAITAMADGVVSRGVLADIPRHRVCEWLEPGETVTPADVTGALADAGIELRQGDIVLVRTGHERRRRALGPWDVSSTRAGLHPRLLPLLRERQVAAVGMDGDPDATPPVVDGVRNPVLAMGTVAMGLPFLDSLGLEDLAAVCEQEARWEFLCVIAPLRIPGGTGSPVNPIAVF